VRQESLAIDAQYEKKRKQAEVGWKMYVYLSFWLVKGKLTEDQWAIDRFEQLANYGSQVKE
jgi:hypothetical protein